MSRHDPDRRYPGSEFSMASFAQRHMARGGRPECQLGFFGVLFLLRGELGKEIGLQ